MEKTTKGINIRDLPLKSHRAWEDLRLLLKNINPGGFKTWTDVFKFITNDKSFWDTVVDMVIDEAKKRFKEENQQ